MSLRDHATAARILATELTAEAKAEFDGVNPDRTVVGLLARMSNAHLNAADRMEQADREEATMLSRALLDRPHAIGGPEMPSLWRAEGPGTAMRPYIAHLMADLLAAPDMVAANPGYVLRVLSAYERETGAVSVVKRHGVWGLTLTRKRQNAR